MKKQGRGQGTVEEYKPWLTIRDISSSGFSHRIKGWKTNRTHHFLSNLELSFFFWLEWSPNIVDIRERYPLLPIEKTIEVAEQFNFKHPKEKKSGEHIVMTTDFLVDYDIESSRNIKKAYSVTPYNRLNQTRFLRRTFIERGFWHSQGIDFTVITDKDIPIEISNNVEWFWSARQFDFLPVNTYEELFFTELTLSENLTNSSMPLAKACLFTDDQLGLKPGSSIQLVKHLIANRYWEVDMTKRITTSKPLVFNRNIDLFQANQKGMIE